VVKLLYNTNGEAAGSADGLPDEEDEDDDVRRIAVGQSEAIDQTP
jgi:hypothetical protein